MRPPDAKATTKNVQWDHRPSIHMRRKMAVGTARAQVTRALRTATEMLLTAFARNTPRASPHTTHARRNVKAAGKKRPNAVPGQMGKHAQGDEKKNENDITEEQSGEPTVGCRSAIHGVSPRLGTAT